MSGLTRCIAVAVAALLTLSAAPAQAATASSTESLVHGTVTSAGRPVAGVPVGTWSPSHGEIATTVTDSRGDFALDSPSSVPVELWAGAVPTATRAVFRVRKEHLVRGVVGGEAAPGTAGPLWQVVDPAVPDRLNGGRPVDLHLQAAARFTSRVARGGDGSIALVRVQDDPYEVEADRGRIDSGWLVPGAYRVRWGADAEHLPVSTTVRLRPGSRTIDAPTLPCGATVSIRATSGDARVGPGVHAIEVAGSASEDAGMTDSSGTLTLRDVAPGRHTYVIGRGAAGADGAPEVPLTDDRYLPATVTVRIRPDQSRVSADVELKSAGHITGQVTAAAHHRTVVIAEDTAGVPVRVTAATKDTFALGGLPAGTYRLLAEDTRAGRYTERRITVTAGATVTLAQPLQPTTPEPVLTGRLADEGTVLLRSAVDLRVFRRQVTTDHLGRFQLRIFPGRFTPVTFVQGRTQAVGCAITVRTSVNLRLPSGSREAAMKGRGRINGGTVLITPTLTGPRILNEEFGEGGPSSAVYSTEAQGNAFTGTHLPAGKYRVGDLDGSVPVTDGPWHYRVQHKPFRLTPDRTTDIRDVELQIAD
jgi:hypothetical protein